MEEIKQTKFLRKTVKVGNSCGVILPKYLLGANVRVIVVSHPLNPKKDVMNILESVMENILGIYIIKIESNFVEILAVTTDLRDHIEKGRYKIDLVPLQVIKKSVREKSEVKEKIKNAKVIINKNLLSELRGI